MAPGFNTPPPLKTRSPRKKPLDVLENLPRLGLHPVAPGTCTTPICGDVADLTDEADLQDGWVRAGVYGSADPDRVWCSGLCATYGIALAELRVTSKRVAPGA
ncbi:hypothetical protein E6R60_05730 [Streptomyces sp. A0642]|uniref:hypothetical protein n=1 Tax=Streptomyces sp. A0642 TaxID=2563100 RepID=UPI0010A26742|nr:hypothetical protein [Streptomyces sp. A0642]THA78385.1 hypothetical protein E6R60_05730 [Streptomyces sp. A0642]